MTHGFYVAASYGLTVGAGGWLAAAAWLRSRKAARRLRAIDPRSAR
jgi:heme exporter protein CcmD